MNDEITCPDCHQSFFGANRERQLGGHSKTHRHHRDDAPACFLDPRDWEATFARLRTEHPTKTVITANFALSESCAICPLGFMKEMQAQGRCHPPKNAWPQRDIGDDDVEEAV